MLRMILGEAKSGKTKLIHEEIEKAIASGNSNRIMLLVPEQYTLEAEKALLYDINKSGFLGVEVVSFKRLIHRLLEEVRMPPSTEITMLGRSVLLRKIMNSSFGELKYYKMACRRKGFLSKFNDFIEELKHGLVTSEKLNEAMLRLDESSLLYKKLSDINYLLNAYEKAKTKDYMDSADIAMFAIELIAESQRLKNKLIWIDGFDSFSNMEYRIIECLIGAAKNTTITIPCGETEVFSHTFRIKRKLSEIAYNNSISTEIINMNKCYGNKEIFHLANNLMIYPFETYKGEVEHIYLNSAASLFSEVERCLVNIVELVRDEKYDFKDIAVVTNDLEGYEFILRQLFDEYKIPYFIDQKMDVMSNPLLHIVDNAIKIVSNNFKREHVLSFMKAMLLDFTHEEIATFENYIISFGIKGQRYNQDFARGDEEYNLEEINKTRCTLLSSLEPLLKFSSGKKYPVKDLLTELFNFLHINDIQGRLEDKVEHFLKVQDFDHAQQFSQAWNIVLDIINQIVELMENEKITLDELGDLLEVAFDAVEIGVIPLRENQVLIGSLDRSKAHPIKALFILGMNDGILPEAGGDKQLLEDQDKEQLLELGYDLFRDTKMFAEKEAYNIYNAITRPAERIYFSYSMTGKNSSAIRPSYLVPRLKKIFDELIELHDAVGLDLSQIPWEICTREGSIKHLAAQMRRSIDGHLIHDAWLSVFDWYAKHDTRIKETLLNGVVYDNKVNILENRLVEGLYEMPLKTSVSRLEQFMWCPFKHFVSYGLKPNRIKSYEISYPDVGILFHSTLEHFGKYLHESGIDWGLLEREECDKIIENIVDLMLDKELFKSKFQYQYLINKVKRVSKRAIWTLTKQLKQGDFIPVAFEMAFSDSGFGAPPIVVELENGESLMLRGVIDRVDMLSTAEGNFVKIIDYKSGAANLSLSDIYHGLQMQLMIYLKACIDNPEYFRLKEVKPGGVFYFKIDDPMIKSSEDIAENIEKQIEQYLRLDGIAVDKELVLEKIDKFLMENGKSTVMRVSYKKDGTLSKESNVIPDEIFSKMIEHVVANVKEIGNSLLGGDIRISPCQSDGRIACATCDYKSLCQFDIRLKDNGYRILPKLKDEDVVAKIGGSKDDSMDC